MRAAPAAARRDPRVRHARVQQRLAEVERRLVLRGRRVGDRERPRAQLVHERHARLPCLRAAQPREEGLAQGRRGRRAVLGPTQRSSAVRNWSATALEPELRSCGKALTC